MLKEYGFVGELIGGYSQRVPVGQHWESGHQRAGHTFEAFPRQICAGGIRTAPEAGKQAVLCHPLNSKHPEDRNTHRTAVSRVMTLYVGFLSELPYSL